MIASFLDEIGLFSPNFFEKNLMQFYVRVRKRSVDPNWVYALDRRPNNVMMEEHLDKLHLWAVDHEHRLNNCPDEDHPSYRLEDEKRIALKGICHPTQMAYGIRKLFEIENAIRRIVG